MREMIIGFSVALAIVLFIVGTCTIVEINSSRIESRLYNERYGTHYSTSDFYWAGNTIKRRFHVQKEETYNLKVESK